MGVASVAPAEIYVKLAIFYEKCIYDNARREEAEQAQLESD